MTRRERVALLLAGTHRFLPVLMSTRYVSHPVTGAGQIVVAGAGLTRKVPYDHDARSGLDEARAAVAAMFDGFDVVIDHSPDVLTGYRFHVYAVDASEAKGA